MIFVFNTLTRQKEQFQTLEPNRVRMYVCGPTVYNYIHLGNARPLCVFDVFRRFLEYRGYDVLHVQNFTDVNDKIIRQGKEEGLTPEQVAEKYIAEYTIDAHGLNVLDPVIQPRVSNYIEKIFEFIQILIDKGYAYSKNGDVYYRTRKFKKYGILSGQSMDDLISGARVEINESKENPLDFALWKRCSPEEQHWNSPWGPGRPGWHIECSCMALDTLGQTIDLHCGGQDLIFPHHENEIAQSEACNGVEFSHYWMHNGHINVDHKKMSKSLNNFFLVRDVAKQFGYEPIRMLMIQAHYRTPMNYSAEMIESCIASLDRLYQCQDTLRKAIVIAPPGKITPKAAKFFEDTKNAFIAAMENDLNTADALAAVFDLVRQLNIMAADGSVSKEQLTIGSQLYKDLADVLGILYERKDEAIPQDILNLVAQRTLARKEKRFAEADQLRDEITAKGYEVRETKQGTEIKKIKKNMEVVSK